MPTETLQCGVPLAVAQTTPYALPVHVVHLLATAEVDYSPDGGSTWVATTAATTGVTLTGTHVRCTAATNCVITVNRYN